MFPKWIFCIFIMFSLCGFYPQLSTKTVIQKISDLIFIVHVSFFVLYTTYSVFTMNFTLLHFSQGIDSMSFLETLNEFVPSFFTSITFCIIICESYFLRNNQRKFWQLFRYINKHYTSHTSVLYRCYSLKLLEYFCYCSISVFYIIIVLGVSPIERGVLQGFVIIAQVLLLFICQVRPFYYLFYVELVKFELKIIENRTKHIHKSCQTEIFWKVCNQNHRISRFTWIRQYYQMIYKLNELMNMNFGWSIFAAFLYCFCTGISDLNGFANEEIFLGSESKQCFTILKPKHKINSFLWSNLTFF